MNIMSQIKKEDGMGFVESLMAIVIAGTACIALLSLGASVIREAEKNEMRDMMTQYSKEGLDKIKYLNTVNTAAVACTDGQVKHYYLNGDQLVLVAVPTDLCSSKGADGTCEKLKLRADGQNLFFREIDIECAGTTDKVSVRVGTLNPKYNISTAVMVGYLP